MSSDRTESLLRRHRLLSQFGKQPDGGLLDETLQADVPTDLITVMIECEQREQSGHAPGAVAERMDAQEVENQRTDGNYRRDPAATRPLPTITAAWLRPSASRFQSSTVRVLILHSAGAAYPGHGAPPRRRNRIPPRAICKNVLFIDSFRAAR